MTGARDLFAATRAHDLPPRWDGRRVEWGGWHDRIMHVCGRGARPRDVCTACGSLASTVMNVGTVHPLAGEMFTVSRTIAKRARRSGRQYDKKLPPTERPAWPVIALTAFRCPDCSHDVVWDSRTDEWWDLDPSDYQGEGSRVT